MKITNVVNNVYRWFELKDNPLLIDQNFGLCDISRFQNEKMIDYNTFIEMLAKFGNLNITS